MRSLPLAIALLVTLSLAACRSDDDTAPPPPFSLTREATGHYCGMNVEEHTGPKGQIILASQDPPVWFSSARDALAFTMLAEEPKDVRAIYVSDMAKAPSWEEPGADNWVEARRALFVIGSRRTGGMGTPEAVPFSNRDAALRFAEQHGGSVVGFEQIPRSYVLTAPQAEPHADRTRLEAHR